MSGFHKIAFVFIGYLTACLNSCINFRKISVDEKVKIYVCKNLSLVYVMHAVFKKLSRHKKILLQLYNMFIVCHLNSIEIRFCRLF